MTLVAEPLTRVNAGAIVSLTTLTRAVRLTTR